MHGAGRTTHSNQREVHSSARTESGLQDVQEHLMASIRDGLQGGHHTLRHSKLGPSSVPIERAEKDGPWMQVQPPSPHHSKPISQLVPAHSPA